MKKLDWQNNTKEYFLIKNEARHIILHPEILKYIHENKPQNILDFGCGDGSLFSNLDRNYSGEITLYDINKDILNVAKNKVKHSKTNVIENYDDIPENSFDLIILSCVLLAVKDGKTYRNILEKLFKAKKKGGRLLLGTTHPCFRNVKFGTFHNEYVKGAKQFNYLKNGDSFNVYIPDQQKKEVIFVDYHRTISYKLNLLTEIGYRLVSMIELEDKPFEDGDFYNQNIPSFLILICE